MGDATFVFPSLNNSFMPTLMNSGREINSKCTVARSPVRRRFCGWSMETMRTVCRTACTCQKRGTYLKRRGSAGSLDEDGQKAYTAVQHGLELREISAWYLMKHRKVYRPGSLVVMLNCGKELRRCLRTADALIINFHDQQTSHSSLRFRIAGVNGK